MPTYGQGCTKCKHEFDDFRTMSRVEENPKCPKCGGKTKRLVVGGVRSGDAWTEYESEALGVHPDQIPEIKKQFPHHDFNPQTGAMIIKSRSAMKRVLKDISYRDWDSFY